MTFDVDETALRGLAPALALTGARVVAGAAQVPSEVTVPRWPASVAAAAAADAGRDALLRLGSGIVAAGDLVAVTADDYRAADDRAVLRLRAVR